MGSAANRSGESAVPPVTPVKVDVVLVNVFSTELPVVPPSVSRKTVMAFTACSTVMAAEVVEEVAAVVRPVSAALICKAQHGVSTVRHQQAVHILNNDEQELRLQAAEELSAGTGLELTGYSWDRMIAAWPASIAPVVITRHLATQ